MQTTSPDIISKYVKAGWWGEVTLNSIFASAVKDNPKSLAICDPINRDKMVSGNMLRLSFSELESHVEHVAHCLYVNGLRKNDKIILQMPNVVEIVLVYLAASRLGLIISPVAMEYGHHELKFIGDTIKPKAYIVMSIHREENVDSPKNFSDLLESIDELAKKYSMPIIISTHPRTKKKLKE